MLSVFKSVCLQPRFLNTKYCKLTVAVTPCCAHCVNIFLFFSWVSVTLIKESLPRSPKHFMTWTRSYPYQGLTRQPLTKPSRKISTVTQTSEWAVMETCCRGKLLLFLFAVWGSCMFCHRGRIVFSHFLLGPTQKCRLFVSGCRISWTWSGPRATPGHRTPFGLSGLL